MIKKTYLFFYYTLFFGTGLAVLLLIGAAREEAPELVGEYLLKPLGVEYSTIDGSLMKGFVIRDLRYKDVLSIKRAELRYRMYRLVRRVPRFDLLSIENALVNPGPLDGTAGGTAPVMPAFSVSTVVVDSLEIAGSEHVNVSLNVKNLRHEGVWHATAVDARGTIAGGKYRADMLHAQGVRYGRVLSIAKLDAAGALGFETGDAEITMLKAENIRYDKAFSVEKLHTAGSMHLMETDTDIKTLTASGVRYDGALSIARMGADAQIRAETGFVDIHGLKASNVRYDGLVSISDVMAVVSLQHSEYGAYAADLHARRLRYDTDIGADMFEIRADTPYGGTHARGSITSGRVVSKVSLSPDRWLVDKYLGFVKGIPAVLECDVNATSKDIRVFAPLERVLLSADENLSARNAAVTLSYAVESGVIDFDALYTLFYGDYSALVRQKGVAVLSGAYATDLEASQILHPSIDLPFERLSAHISGDAEAMAANIDAAPLGFELMTKGYQRFVIRATSRGLPLSFISGLPDVLRKDILSGDANATLNVSPFSLRGTLSAEGYYMFTHGAFAFDDGSILYSTTIRPKAQSELFRGLDIEKFSPLDVLFYAYGDSQVFYLDAGQLDATFIKEGFDVSGWGGLGRTRFDANGTISDDADTHIAFRASTESVHELLDAFSLAETESLEYYDAGVNVQGVVSLSDALRLKGRIELPWYAARIDSKRSFAGAGSFMDFSYAGRIAEIARYRFDVAGVAVYSDKPSVVHVDDNATVRFEEIRLYDDLVLRGVLKFPETVGALTLRSDRFTYAGKEGNVTARVDIAASFNGPLSQTFEGEVTFMDGVIRYAPPREYSIHDEDITIIQDIKPPSKVDRKVNIKVTAENALLYDNEGVAVRFSPDIVIWQENAMPVQILGLISVHGGDIKAEDKEFTASPGEIYFYGARPVNPYLNLLLHHSVEGKEIEINIANTLESPVFIFSSNPMMSQDDIISYLLFGAPSTTVFESSKETADAGFVGGALLGTGLKKMFNKATGVKVDKLNILTSKEGKLGYEVGARLGKKLRLLYKSETTSSVVLQYSVNDSVRVDVDVYETGQGVSLLFVKDFSDPLRDDAAK